MSIINIILEPKRGLIRGFVFALFALTLSGCAVGSVAGAAVSLVSGTVTAAADVTSSVVGGVADAVTPDSDGETTD